MEISAIMAVYNAEDYVLQGVQSVLGQTYRNFELIIVDDGSTDRTPAILASITDNRIRVLRQPVNLGVVAARNHAVSVARGRYCAIIDADDICIPTRFFMQKNWLDGNSSILLLGSEMSILENGRVTRGLQFPSTDPVVLAWMLHHGNPLGHSSIMFRTSVVDRMGAYLREEMKYAEDFDFLHRVARHGGISVLLERLLIYRRHEQNLTRTRREEMLTKTAAVLSQCYELLSLTHATAAAERVARHIVGGDPVTSGRDLEQLGESLDAVLAAFLARHKTSARQSQLIADDARRVWWRCVLGSIRSGSGVSAIPKIRAFSGAKADLPPLAELGRAVGIGLLPAKSLIRGLRARAASRARPQSAFRRSPLSNGITFGEAAEPPDGPPRLYVTIDAESEFDWSLPFNRALTSVRSMSFQKPAQDIFNDLGICPIYLVDYPVASQPEGYEPVRDFLLRRQCVVGAHLHPWTTPPFEEIVSQANSYGCNLAPDLEFRKMEVLKATITDTFGVQPLFFKAGRYGVGPCTIAALDKLGFKVDMSIMPGADYRADGGPDFAGADASPAMYAGGQILSVPMTRGQTGLFPHLAPTLARSARLPGPTSRLRGALAHLGLVNTVTLTPEGMSAEEQKALLKSMVKGGYRTFVLHYHSPSLAPGNTPYVRTSMELVEFLRRLRSVCEFFIRDIGGLAASPGDLLAPQDRHLLWPDQPCHVTRLRPTAAACRPVLRR